MGVMVPAGCSHEEMGAAQPNGDTSEAMLTLTPGIAAVEGAPATKVAGQGAISGTEFGARTIDFGLFLCNHEDAPVNFTPVMDGYDNLFARVDGRQNPAGTPPYLYERWQFRRNGERAYFTTFGIRKDTKVDLYAYFPYTRNDKVPSSTDAMQQTTFDVTAIPFTSGNNDYMWADPVPNIQDIPREPDPDDGNKQKIPITLRFHHVMALMEFTVKQNFTGSMGSVFINLHDKKGRLVSTGTFSAVDGSVTSGVTADSVSVHCPFQSIPNAYQSTYLMFPAIPEGIEAGDLSITLTLNGHEMISEPIVVPLTNLAYNDGGTKHGLRRGYRYRYRINIDNYVKFEPLDVTPWEDTPKQIDYEI